MKKQLTCSLALAVLLVLPSLAADAPRLLARLPGVDKLPARSEIVLHVDFQRLGNVPFLAKARAGVPGPASRPPVPASLLGRLGAPFDGAFLDDIQEVLFFQVDLGSDPLKRAPLSGAYLRGTFRKTEMLTAYGKGPSGSIEGLDLYAIEAAEELTVPSRFLFLAENAMLIGEEPFLRQAIGALRGKVPALSQGSPIARIFQNDRSYLLGIAKSEALSFDQQGSPLEGQAAALGLGGFGDDPPSAYLLSLAPMAGKTDSIRASLDLAFRSEQAMLKARDSLNGLLAFLAMGAQGNEALQALQKRLKVTGLHKRVRIALEIDEELLALAAMQMEAVAVQGAGGKSPAEGTAVPGEGMARPPAAAAPAGPVPVRP